MYSIRGPRHNHCVTVSLTAQLLLQDLHEKLTQAMAVASAVWQIPVVNDNVTYDPYTYIQILVILVNTLRDSWQLTVLLKNINVPYTW